MNAYDMNVWTIGRYWPTPFFSSGQGCGAEKVPIFLFVKSIIRKLTAVDFAYEFIKQISSCVFIFFSFLIIHEKYPYLIPSKTGFNGIPGLDCANSPINWVVEPPTTRMACRVLFTDLLGRRPQNFRSRNG